MPDARGLAALPRWSARIADLRQLLSDDPLVLKARGRLASGSAPRCKLGLELDGCEVRAVPPGGPAFATRQIAEGHSIVAVDGQAVTPESIAHSIIGDDLDGSLCHLHLSESATGTISNVFLRRVRADVVHDQELVFELLAKLNSRVLSMCSPTADAGREDDVALPVLIEQLGQQFMKILLDRHDRDAALSAQHRSTSEQSIAILAELETVWGEINRALPQQDTTLGALSCAVAASPSLSSAIGADQDVARCAPAERSKQNAEQIAKLEADIVRHTTLEAELKGVINALKTELRASQASESQLRWQCDEQQRTLTSLTQIQEEQAALVGQSREQADLVHGAKQKMDWMQDEIYRLEDALREARQEIRRKDEHILAIEKEFEELQQVMNQLDSFFANFSSVTKERDSLRQFINASQNRTEHAFPEPSVPASYAGLNIPQDKPLRSPCGNLVGASHEQERIGLAGNQSDGHSDNTANQPCVSPRLALPKPPLLGPEGMGGDGAGVAGIERRWGFPKYATVPREAENSSSQMFQTNAMPARSTQERLGNQTGWSRGLGMDNRMGVQVQPTVQHQTSERHATPRQTNIATRHLSSAATQQEASFGFLSPGTLHAHQSLHMETGPMGGASPVIAPGGKEHLDPGYPTARNGFPATTPAALARHQNQSPRFREAPAQGSHMYSTSGEGGTSAYGQPTAPALCHIPHASNAMASSFSPGPPQPPATYINTHKGQERRRSKSPIARLFSRFRGSSAAEG